ncbi:MAG: acyl-CoA dehydrogenase, partial [Chloroflexi bacterium]
MPGVSFELSEEQRMLRDMAHEFAANEILPVADEYDRTAEFPWPLVRQAQELGLVNVNVPEEYGGSGVGVLSECVIGEELNWACSGIATAMLINNLAAVPIILAGTEEQKREWLGRLTRDGHLAAYALTEPAAGSDVLGTQTTATRHGNDYVLRGSKTFISNASVSDFYVVFAHTDKSKGHNGMSAFIVER